MEKIDEESEDSVGTLQVSILITKLNSLVYLQLVHEGACTGSWPFSRQFHVL